MAVFLGFLPMRELDSNSRSPSEVGMPAEPLRPVASEIALQAGIRLAWAAYHPLTLLSNEHLTYSIKSIFPIDMVVHQDHAF